MSIHCAICGYEKKITEDFRKWPLLGETSIDIYPVTRHGKLDEEVRGFICASCLQCAKSMRLHIKSLMKGIRVTNHALERYMSRFTNGDMTEDSAKSALIKVFSYARRINFKDYFMVKRIMNNDFKEAHYYYRHGIIFVTTIEKPLTILTVETSRDKEIGSDFWYVDA